MNTKIEKLKEYTQKVKERTDIIQVIGDRIPIRKNGKNFLGLCPFHKEKSPSFTINPSKQMYYCFGCGAGGDVFKFIQLFESKSFADVVKELGEKVGYRQSDNQLHIPSTKLGKTPKAKPNSKSGAKPSTPKADCDFFDSCDYFDSTTKVKLLQLPEPAWDIPTAKPVSEVGWAIASRDVKVPRNRSEVQEIIYHYSPTQEIYRFQWTAPNKPKGRDKTFRQRSVTDGDWIWTKGAETWPSYHQDEILEFLIATEPRAILLVEGEDSVERAREIGLAATTFQGSSWSSETIAGFLKSVQQTAPNTTIAFLRDNDEAGQAKSDKIETQCKELGIKFAAISPIEIFSECMENGDIREILTIMDAEEFIQKLEQRIHQAVGDNYASYYDSEDYEWNQTPAKPNKPPAQSVMAKEIAEYYRSELAWNAKFKVWYRYSGKIEGIWSKEIDEFVARVAKVHLDVAEYDYSANYLSGVMQILKVELAVETWNELQDVVPLLNGVLNPRTMEFQNHSAANYLTWCLPYNYQPGDDCQPIKDWFLSASGSSDVTELLRAYLKAVVCRRADIHRFIELYGPGGTGKSTLIKLAQALAGMENNFTTELKHLENNRFELAGVHGKGLVTITDSERYGGSVAILKALTGGDSLRFEQKNIQQSDAGFTFKGMVILAANERIQSSDYTSGLQRRRICIPFFNKIPQHEQRNLLEFVDGKPSGEFTPFLPGLLNWILSMPDAEMMERLKNTASSVPSLQEVEAEALTESNPIADWVDNCVVIDSTGKTYVGVAKRDKSPDSENQFLNINNWLYANYAEYTTVTGNRTISCKRFVSLLRDLLSSQLGYSIATGRDNRGSFFSGILIRSDIGHDEIPRPITGIIPDFHSPEIETILAKVTGCNCQSDGLVTGRVTGQHLGSDAFQPSDSFSLTLITRETNEEKTEKGQSSVTKSDITNSNESEKDVKNPSKASLPLSDPSLLSLPTHHQPITETSTMSEPIVETKLPTTSETEALIVELVEFIQDAIKENDPQYARDAAGIVKSVCEAGHADRKVVWERLSESEQTAFTTLIKTNNE